MLTLMRFLLLSSLTAQPAMRPVAGHLVAMSPIAAYLSGQNCPELGSRPMTSSKGKGRMYWVSAMQRRRCYLSPVRRLLIANVAKRYRDATETIKLADPTLCKTLGRSLDHEYGRGPGEKLQVMTKLNYPNTRREDRLSFRSPLNGSRSCVMYSECLPETEIPCGSSSKAARYR
jgi:hypothetical protein